MHKGVLAVATFLLIGATQAEAAKKIKILLKTDNGLNVTADIKVKSFPSNEIDAYVLSSGNGFSIIALEKCDEFVSLNAVPNVFGISRKINDDVPEWLPCEEPEIVFNDFQIQIFTVSVRNPIYGKADFWRQTLGQQALIEKPHLAEELATAFQGQEYGKISLITTEWQNVLRESGKTQEADMLYSLAVDAAAQGVLSVKARSDLNEQTLQYSPVTKRFELSKEVQSVIRDYKSQSYNFPQNPKDLGQIDWNLMRSLQGGADVSVPDVKLDADKLNSFSFDRNSLSMGPP